MKELVDKIVQDWANEISSLEVDGYSKVIDNITCKPCVNYWTSEGCYTVVFSFYGYAKTHDNRVTKPVNIKEDRWNNKLNELFISELKSDGIPFRGSTVGEWRFENSKADYFVNQGHRFTVQFYPRGMLASIRNDIINDLLNDNNIY